MLSAQVSNQPPEKPVDREFHGEIRLFSTDLDGTLIGDADSTWRFQRLWNRIPIGNRPLLAYNSGRLVADQRSLIRQGVIQEPDYLIGGVGTEIYDVREGRMLGAFTAQFGDCWDLPLIEEIVGSCAGVKRQPPEFLSPYKSSWYLHGATPAGIAELKQRLVAGGLSANVVYSSQRDLDVIPALANKGNALAWLCDALQIQLSATVVAGDTSNDSSMFHLAGVRGIIVKNAHFQLTEEIAGQGAFHASRETADGVIEGLCHYGLDGGGTESFSARR